MAAAPPEWPALSASRTHRRTQHHPSGTPLSKENIYVLEKAREAGQHCLSGAILDPRAMRELLPGFETEAPIEATVTKKRSLPHRDEHFRSPLRRRRLQDHATTSSPSTASSNGWRRRWKPPASPSSQVCWLGLLYNENKVTGFARRQRCRQKDEKNRISQAGYDIHAKS